jgi:excinuclease ABC subunit C
VRRLNERFGLRDCPQSQEMAFADQTELFPILRAAGCIRHEIGTCLGPCAGGCTRNGYAKHVRAARDFLAGTDVTLLDQLHAEMAAASAALAFERAAALRDKWEALNWLHQRLERMRQIRGQERLVYPVRGIDGKEIWYVIDGGRVVHAAAAGPRDEDRFAASHLRIKSLRRRTKDAACSVPEGEVEQVLLVAAWFRRRPDEAARKIAAPPLFASPSAAPPLPIRPEEFPAVPRDGGAESNLARRPIDPMHACVAHECEGTPVSIKGPKLR